MRTVADLEQLESAAGCQPGAIRRDFGIKFQCPACAVEGHDQHQDNACLFSDGTWGCAWAKDTELGRVHWRAIGTALGAFDRPAPVQTADLPAASVPTLLICGMGAFLAQTFPEPGPLVEDILSDDGGGWIGGEEKLGKSWWMIDESVGLALGLPVAGRFAVPRRRRVMIFEEEDSPRRTHRRVRANLRGRGVDPDDPAVQHDLDAWLKVSVWSGFSLDNPLLVVQLETAIRDFAPAVVYIDCLRKVTLKDLNKASDASSLLAILDDLRRRYNVIFRLIHHFRKQQGFRTGRGSQEIGGSFVLGAWAENSLFFEPIGRKQGLVRVEVQSKDGAPVPPFRLAITTEGPRHAPTVVRITAEEDRVGDESDELVFQAVATLPKETALAGQPGVSVTAVAMALKKSPKTIRRALKRLQDVERVVVIGQAAKGKDLFAVPE
jgi:AAA domain